MYFCKEEYENMFSRTQQKMLFLVKPITFIRATLLKYIFSLYYVECLRSASADLS